MEVIWGFGIKVLDGCVVLFWQGIIDDKDGRVYLPNTFAYLFMQHILIWVSAIYLAKIANFQSNMCSFSSQNRLLHKKFCLQPFYQKDLVSLLFAYYLVHYLCNDLLNLCLQIAGKCISDTFLAAEVGN